MSTYKEALSLLMERFPCLALLAPQWSPKEVPCETLSSLQIEKAEVLYFYGLGRGESYFACKKWLEENSKRVLIILEDEPGVLASFLHLPVAIEILANEQVHMKIIARKEHEFDALAESYPVRRIEIAALPSYTNRKFQNIRLKLLRKTTLSHAVYLDRIHGYQPFQNFVKNVSQLSSSFYANALKGAFQDVPAIVCGAGPSLQQSMETLRKLENKALIIAGGSTLAALSSEGVLPHFGMAIDPNLEEYRRLKNSFTFEVPLLYSTRVFPDIFHTCNGPFGYMRSGIGGVSELWIEEELGLIGPLLGDFLSPESISVTSICVAWAQFLGCNPILLNGVDLAYTGNKRYAKGVMEEEELAFASIDEEKSAPDRIIKKRDRNGNPIYTAVRWVMESASLSHFAKKHSDVKFINTTEGGIGFTNIPYSPLEKEMTTFKEQNIRVRVQKEIAAAQMPPDTRELIQSKMGELKKSLHRVIDHLKILSGKQKGSSALAEMELKEEMAYLYLFFDMPQLIKKDYWKTFLDIALKYEAVFS